SGAAAGFGRGCGRGPRARRRYPRAGPARCSGVRHCRTARGGRRARGAVLAAHHRRVGGTSMSDTTPRPGLRAMPFGEFIVMLALLFATVAFSIDAMLPLLAQMGAEL